MQLNYVTGRFSLQRKQRIYFSNRTVLKSTTLVHYCGGSLCTHVCGFVSVVIWIGEAAIVIFFNKDQSIYSCAYFNRGMPSSFYHILVKSWMPDCHMHVCVNRQFWYLSVFSTLLLWAVVFVICAQGIPLAVRRGGELWRGKEKNERNRCFFFEWLHAGFSKITSFQLCKRLNDLAKKPIWASTMRVLLYQWTKMAEKMWN